MSVAFTKRKSTNGHGDLSILAICALNGCRQAEAFCLKAERTTGDRCQDNVLLRNSSANALFGVLIENVELTTGDLNIDDVAAANLGIGVCLDDDGTALCIGGIEIEV